MRGEKGLSPSAKKGKNCIWGGNRGVICGRWNLSIGKWTLWKKGKELGRQEKSTGLSLFSQNTNSSFTPWEEGESGKGKGMGYGGRCFIKCFRG